MEYPSQLLVNSDAVTRAGNLSLHHSKSWNNDRNNYNKKITTCPRETRGERERELLHIRFKRSLRVFLPLQPWSPKPSNKICITFRYPGRLGITHLHSTGIRAS